MNGMPKIRELREQKKLTQKQLGEKVGTTGAHIQHIERGNRNLTPQMAQKMGSIFGVPWYSLYPQEDERPNDTG